MRILIAEDDAVSRRLLENTLKKWRYDVISTTNGAEAVRVLASPDAPTLAILDWMMPVANGPSVCRQVRSTPQGRMQYLIMLTAKDGKQDIVHGLTAGADDFLSKPFDRAELQARIQVGERILRLEAELSTRVSELELALSRVKQLQGLLPICCYCKKIRNDQNYWEQVESYITKHSDAQFSHGICPDCHETHLAPQIAELTRRRRAQSES